MSALKTTDEIRYAFKKAQESNEERKKENINLMNMFIDDMIDKDHKEELKDLFEKNYMLTILAKETDDTIEDLKINLFNIEDEYDDIDDYYTTKTGFLKYWLCVNTTTNQLELKCNGKTIESEPFSPEGELQNFSAIGLALKKAFNNALKGGEIPDDNKDVSGNPYIMIKQANTELYSTAFPVSREEEWAMNHGY